MKKNKITIILIVIAIAIIATVCILFGKNDNNTDINAPIINIGDQNNDLNNDINEENDDVNNEEEEEEINYQQVELNKKKETYEFDKLHLEFTGTSTGEGEDYFKYLLNIKYNGKKIESNFFNDNKNYRIYSSEMAANFRIYKIEDVYVLVSSIARQCLGSEAIVFNTDGKVLKTFAMAEISVEDNIINVSTSDDNNCMILNNYKNSKYKVIGKTITEQK